MEQHHPTLRRMAAGALAAVMLVGCAGVTAFAAEGDAFTLGIYSTTSTPSTARKSRTAT